MRSGNGRHRRPRQAPAIFVTAGVTGSAIALPLLGAGSAHAADTATWDRVAQCESGGVWSSASGNGFYGGLQLTQDMWDDHGGATYASRPDYASRSQQISVAEAILDDLGPDAWPSCAVNAGLTQDGRAPSVDPGGTSSPRPDPSESSDTDDSSNPWDPSGSSSDDPDPSDTSDATPAPEASDPFEPTDPTDSSDAPEADEPSDSATPGDDEGDHRGDRTDGSDRGDDSGDDSGRGDEESGSPSDSGSADHEPSETPTKGKHRGGSDDAADDDKSDGKSGDRGDADAGGPGDEDRPSGRHASRGDDAHRTEPADGEYTVRAGDSLSAIAERHELAGGWTALYDRNEDVVGDDADLIHPGQLLNLGN
ncbi:transglycosylase family protein [Streptomyces sp. NPDC091266]|uniref:transglycosylase family protein n=1 Tax=Streptomyces sp. NPDC091266 TaxID=3365978 RepID=UPI0037F980D4